MRFNADKITEPMYQDILDIVDETIEEIEYWHSDYLTKEEREHPRGNGWARVYDKLQKIKIFYDGK